MIKPKAMRKLPECDRCLLYSHNSFLVCAVHPAGPVGDTCLDFRSDPDAENEYFEDFLGLEFSTGEGMGDNEPPINDPFDLDSDEELWQPDGATYYNGELIVQPQQRWTPEEQLELLDTHPMFTGRCPQCELPFPRYDKPPIHWDCPCGWVDDSV